MGVIPLRILIAEDDTDLNEINGGTLDITAVDEGISAISSVEITDGTITIQTSNNRIKTDGSFFPLPGVL